MVRRVTSFFVILFCVFAQTPDLAAQQTGSELDSLYAELDSAFASDLLPDRLFSMADSLLALEKMKVSSLHARAGYVSEIVSAGRSFGIDQYGFSSALGYYHRSGIFVTGTGYWSNEYSPSYYLTAPGAGYSHIASRWSASFQHDFFIYNDTLTRQAFDKSARATFSWLAKRWDAGIDYAYLYGGDAAHRLTTFVNGRLKIPLRGLVNSITFMPGASFQFGNGTIFSYRQPRTSLTDLYDIVRQNDYPRLTFREYLRLNYLLQNERRLAYTLFLAERNYSPDDIARLVEAYTDGESVASEEFGFLNYNFSFPLILRAGKFSLLLNYTYNIPRALPGEDVEYEPSGYFSTSLSYTVHWYRPYYGK